MRQTEKGRGHFFYLHSLYRQVLSQLAIVGQLPFTSIVYSYQQDIVINSRIQLMDLSHFSRKSSQANESKGLSMAEKTKQSQAILELLDSGAGLRAPDVLFGYAMASASIALPSRQAAELKKQFETVLSLWQDQVLRRQTLVQIVVDCLNQKKSMYGCSEWEKVDKMLITLQQNIEQSMMNSYFIQEKWNRQSRIQEQARKNQEIVRAMIDEQKRAIRRKAEEAEAQGWECSVCISEIDRDSFGLLQCGHIFHPECINAYLKQKIENSEIQIHCPMEGCGKRLSISDIYTFTDGHLREKFQKFSFNNFVEMSEETNWCPTAGCTAVFAAEQGLDNYRCPICRKHYCLNCRCDYHNGMTCAEYRISNTHDKNDDAFINFVRGAKFKQCPKCKFWVERNKGCSTMTCKCGQQFCYSCGGTSCPHGSCNNSGKK